MIKVNVLSKLENEAFFTLVENELAAGKLVRFCVKGNSMFPLLRDGKDVVVLERCMSNQLQPMDVVLFRYKGNHILHRFLRREGEFLLMQGDGVYASFEYCPVDAVVGRVIQVHRTSGKVLSIESWRWTFPSRLWLYSGFLKKWLLRMAYMRKEGASF